ncbi:hypothetical protein [Pseudoflavitalea rhizosphaerae]|uniref:hypothetical protein n=1 Tax=Pseudoflavitalea rhizosphaerae TaxID=1884793 RepID=UPI000F8F37CF|nr:hypothetical protein [Pseudoflavitalea rhizosphaerae]
MKIWLVICFTFFCTLAATAARKPHDAKLNTRVPDIQVPTLNAKKVFFAPVKSRQNDQQSETFHLNNCSRTSSQCRNNGNDNIISAHTLPLALIICTRSQLAGPVLSVYSGTLSRLLLFPNHYFW